MSKIIEFKNPKDELQEINEDMSKLEIIEISHDNLNKLINKIENLEKQEKNYHRLIRILDGICNPTGDCSSFNMPDGSPCPHYDLCQGVLNK